jgi:hypothetical protein
MPPDCHLKVLAVGGRPWMLAEWLRLKTMRGHILGTVAHRIIDWSCYRGAKADVYNDVIDHVGVTPHTCTRREDYPDDE